MKNADKFKTADERDEAFDRFCTVKKCNNCELGNSRVSINCSFAWLDLEAEEEKPLPCPFCGGETYCSGQAIQCENEDYIYTNVYGYKNANEIIAAHNRVAKAVKAAKKEVE